jgi:microcystin-dependent protein
VAFGASELRQFKLAYRERLDINHDFENFDFQGVHKYKIQTISATGSCGIYDIVRCVAVSSDITVTLPSLATCRATGKSHPILIFHSYSTTPAYKVALTAFAGDTFDITATGSYMLGGVGSAILLIPYAHTLTWVVCEQTIKRNSIVMWSGSVSDLPYGWVLCDGLNGSPDLRGKFLVGYNAAETEFDTIGETGGEKKHTLLVSEMPRHRHSMLGSSSGSGSGGTVGQKDGSTNTGSTGGDTSHENRPPYYTLAYIWKV